MHEENLRDVDLNLLVLLDALLEHQNVTHAAAAMYMSQPAMSRALKRLRYLLSDPILAKGSQGLVLTPKAAQLQPKLKQLLADIRALVSEVDFQPAQLEGSITLAATDHQMIATLPGLMAELEKEAPKLTVQTIPVFRMTPDQLENGSVDLALGVYQDPLPPSLNQTVLGCDRYVTLLRDDHPKLGLTTPEEFASLDHVLVSALGDGRSLIDDLLKQQSLARRIALQVPSFFAAMEIVAKSSFVVTLPAQIGMQYADYFHLAVIDQPLPCPEIQTVIIWAKSMAADDKNRWLRQLILSLFS